MDYIKIVNYRGYEVNVKRPPRKTRSDRKHTVKALLSAKEKKLVNAVMLAQGYDYVVDFVSDAIKNYMHLAITQDDIDAAKRPLREIDGIQVNGRLDEVVYDKFRVIQARENLNQRQVTLVLIKKAVEMEGFRWK